MKRRKGKKWKKNGREGKNCSKRKRYFLYSFVVCPEIKLQPRVRLCFRMAVNKLINVREKHGPVNRARWARGNDFIYTTLSHPSFPTFPLSLSFSLSLDIYREKIQEGVYTVIVKKKSFKIRFSKSIKILYTVPKRKKIFRYW